MARKRKRIKRDHRAIALKAARTRASMKAARGVSRDVSREPSETEHVSREKKRARRLVTLALGGAA